MPPMTAKTTMVVLWTDEIKAASQALKRMNNALSEATSDNEWNALVTDAMNACNVALDGADVEGATLLLSTKPTV